MPKRSDDSPTLLWLVLLAPLVASAVTRGFWAPDEPRYAEVAREVYEPGHGGGVSTDEVRAPLLVMHLCGEVYPDKPPLLFWLAGGLGALLGWHEPVLRLPSLLATLGTALLVLVLARRWWDRDEARLAPGVLLATVMVTEIGARLQIDPLLTFLCTAAIALADAPAATRRRAALQALGAGLFVGLAALAKGPVAYLNVGLPLLLWRLLVHRDRSERASAASLGAATALAVLPVLLWASAVAAIVPEIARDLFYGQHIERAALGTHHEGPFWKPLVRQPFFLLPWTPAVLGGLVLAVRSWRAGRGASDAGVLKAALWFLGLLVVFCITPAKRDLYLLPAYPAAALLAARFVVRVGRSSRLGRFSLWSPGVVLLLGGLVLCLVPLVLGEIPGAEEIPGLAWRCAAAGAIVIACALWVGSRNATAAPARGVGAAFTGWALGCTGIVLLLFPVVDGTKSPRTLATLVAALPQRPSRVPCVSVHPEGYRFYGDLPAVEGNAASLGGHLDREGGDFLALVRERTWLRLPEEERARYRILLGKRVGSRQVLVLGAAEAPDEPHGGTPRNGGRS
jgi:4-amino-4-deoxy-L-arabinose transferase-like glycosyltransferase